MATAITIYDFCTCAGPLRGVCQYEDIENCKYTHLAILVSNLPTGYHIRLLFRTDGTVVDSRIFDKRRLEKFSDAVSQRLFVMSVSDHWRLDAVLAWYGYNRTQ